jgi:hypothetical protein
MKTRLISVSLMLLTAFGCLTVSNADIRCAVDWKKGIYIAEGQVVVQNPKQKASRDKALLEARKSAASRMMALIEKTSVKERNPAKVFEQDSTVKSKIVGVVNTTKPVSTRFETIQAKTVAVVALKIPVFGPNKPGTIIVESTPEAFAPPVADKNSSGYTCLIVDASGLSIKKSMCPRILKSSGEVVYDGQNAPIGRIEEFGVVAYAKALDVTDRIPRCGDRPLIVKATGSSGISNWDVIVADSDAELISKENSEFHFLDKLNVIIVVD